MKNNISVLKFGGTSMGSASTIFECVKVIKERIEENKKPFVVVSAISKMTDTLLKMLDLAINKKRRQLEQTLNDIMKRHFEILHNITKNEKFIQKYTLLLNDKFAMLSSILDGIILTSDYSDQMKAYILSFGEDLSSDLIELSLIENEVNAKKIHSKYLVKTTGNCLSADVDFEKTKKAFKKIMPDIKNGITYIMTGFVGGTSKNKVMLLGRGGSDFSASIAGIALDANIVEIWTDADGILSADPRLIPNAKHWKKMNKTVASEMARAGAKVLHPKTIYASYYNIDIVIRNLFNKENTGTLIDHNTYGNNIYGIVSDKGYSILHFENQNMFGEIGFIAKIGLLANENNIVLDLISTSETSISFTTKTDALTPKSIQLFSSIAQLSVINNVSKISIIGENINTSNNLSNIFSILDKHNIQPLMLTMGQSSYNIGLIVEEKNTENVLSILHDGLIK